jgi:hypothetical protein
MAAGPPWYHARMDQAGPSVPLLHQFLGEHDAPCPACGYNLRGLTGAACPECNSALALRVGLVEPRLGAYVTGLVGWSMGLGLNGLLLVYMLVVALIYSFPGVPLHPFLTHNLVAGVVQGAGLAAWIAWLGPRVRQPDVALRWLHASLGWLVSLVNVVVFAVLIR